MAREAVAYWTQRGLPKAKAVLGVPFYGPGFGAAFKKGNYAYKDIVAKFPGAEQVRSGGRDDLVQRDSDDPGRRRNS